MSNGNDPSSGTEHAGEDTEEPDDPDLIISETDLRACTKTEVYALIVRLEKEYGAHFSNDDLKSTDCLKDEVWTVVSSPEMRAKRREKLWNEIYSTFYEYDGHDRMHLHYAEIAHHLTGRFHALSWNKLLWVYCDGIYVENKGAIEAEILRILGYIGYETGSLTEPNRQILHQMLYTDPLADCPFNKEKDMVPCKNGVVCLDEAKITILPHKPAYCFSYKIPVNYNPEARPDDLLAVFNQWVAPRDVPALWQIPAQAFLQMEGLNFRKTYLTEGERRAGKSSYFELLYRFVGDDNYSKVPLQGIMTNRFALAGMERKLLNLQDDVSSIPLSHMGEFKDLIGNFHHQVERKHVQPYNAWISAVHVYSCNRPPEVKEIDDEAFWDRWYYLTFPNHFPLDPGFAERFYTDENFSAFLNLVLDGMIQMKKTKQLLVDSDLADVRERWVEASNPVAEFIAHHLNRNSVEELTKDDVYEGYLAFCEDNDYDSVLKNRLTSLLEAEGIMNGRSRHIIPGQRTQVYRGVSWQENSPYKPSKLVVCDQTVQGVRGDY